LRARIVDFVQTLRAEGVDVSVAETMDAARAVAAAGVEREVLRESLAACLVKNEDDRPLFDRLFDAAFPLVGAAREAGKRRERVAGGDGAATRASGQGTAAGRGSPREEPGDVPRRVRRREMPRDASDTRRGRVAPRRAPRRPGGSGGATSSHTSTASARSRSRTGMSRPRAYSTSTRAPTSAACSTSSGTHIGTC